MTPTKNPASPPNAIALMITIAIIGLKLGIIKNAARPAVASDYSKSGAYWNHINFKEYPAYPEGIHDYGEVGLWTHPDHISGELHYFFGFLTDSTEIPEGFHKVEIPAGRYAVFTIKSQETPEKIADAVRDGWRYVFTEWLCTQKEYNISHQGMCFECYQGEEAYLYLPVIDL